jgi:predicted glutamine amidotransferase
MFKISTPVWSDKNLQSIGHFITAPVILGHIRAASDGHNKLEEVVISHENCHPFKCGRYTFMHNGGIHSFSSIKREVCNLLRLENYLEIDGSTDSEHIFALFLNNLCCKNIQLPASTIAESLNQTIAAILEIGAAHNIGPSSLNITITDGVHVVVSRFRNSSYSQPPSLYYSVGSDYVAEEGNFTTPESMPGELGQKQKNGILVSSSPLNKDCVEQGGDNESCCTTWSTCILDILAMPCLSLSCFARPCPALPCLALSCLAMPCLAVPPCLDSTCEYFTHGYCLFCTMVDVTHDATTTTTTTNVTTF